jgi:hypothetical protein
MDTKGTAVFRCPEFFDVLERDQVVDAYVGVAQTKENGPLFNDQQLQYWLLRLAKFRDGFYQIEQGRPIGCRLVYLQRPVRTTDQQEMPPAR